MSKIVLTRAAYMADETTDPTALHRAYYGQFVTDQTIMRVVSFIGIDRLQASTDPHMNDIPLRLWDVLVPGLPGSGRFKEAGDYYTQSGGVCLAKEAARQYIENNRVYINH